MKEYIVMMAVCAVALFSCTNESDVLSPNEKENLSDISVRNGMLVFKDKLIYESIERKLNGVSTSDKISFLDSIGFKSQLYIMNEADQELESLCANENADVFNRGYKEFKRKYEKLFMFNNIDNADLSPYCRLEQLDLSLFANNEGLFMIGDSLVKCDSFDTFSDFSSKVSYVMLDSDVSTRAQELNRAHVQVSKRKVGMYLSRSGSSIKANFTAQKKNIFGWVRYSTKYSYKVNVKSGVYHHNTNPFSSTAPIWVIKPGSYIECETAELSGNVTATIAFCPEGSNVSGTFEIWSRGVDYEDRGISTMSL